jgi:exodeoxyribonuclease V beta subunit
MDRHLRLARLRLIRRLFDEAGAALRRRKRELRVAAFDDMLFNLHERLQAVPALAAALRERYPAALVDEFQDTDPLQWAILERVWGGDGGTPLLLVGDPKQAIYAFRNADLPTYLRARERADAVHTLDRNQRSSAALVSALNHLFGAHPRSFLLPGLDYRPLGLGERPRPAFEDETPAAGDLGALQLWLLPRDAGAQPLLREAALRASVQATAAEIARLLREGEARRLRLDGRPLAGGDIAVLVRSHAQGALVRQALAALGVGSVALTPAGVFQAPEAEALQSVLAAVLEPSHAGRLRAALATEAMGFDAAALAALEQDEAALAAHMERFAAWRACWLAHGVAAMLRRWLREAEVAARLLARPEGARRLTNLLHLAERLHEAAAQQASPEALLRWLALRRAQPGVDEADQLRLESDQALVRIVTIHKAKGLEYGVVFCPFLWDAQAPPAATPELVETHDAEGRPVLDLRAGVDDGFDDAALKLQQRTEQAAETLRLAYVALTRAVHRAYLVVGPYTARAGRGFSTQPGSRAALNWLAAGERFTEPAQWFEHALPPAEIEAAWRRLAAGCAALRLAPLPLTPGEPLPPAPARPLEALPPPRHIGAGWRVVEDEALTAGLPEPGQDALATGALGLAWTDASTDGATNTGRDEGGSAGAGAGAMFTVLPAALARDDILRFPQGAAAEAAIRLAFARADFADPASWEEAAWQALRAHPQPGVGGPGGEARERALAAMLQRMLRDVLSTEIAPGLRLRHLASGRWLSGMEFHLPAPGLRAEDLYAALRVLDLPPSAPDAPPLVGGYLRGVIDLVFEHEGRWWLLDWSAALPGQQARAYGAEALAHEAAARGHGLQALLHTLALQRWLRRRVPGWRPETHFGGALRLYVRGVRPGWTNEDGAACGVFLVQPAAEELGKLASLLEG